MARAQYEIRIGGVTEPEDLDALEGQDVVLGAAYTTVTGTFDQAALHGLILRIESLGLELIEVRRVRSARRRQRD